MRKTLLLQLIVVLAIFTSCNKTSEPISEIDKLVVTPTQVDMAYNGGTAVLIVSSTNQWTVESSQTWAKPTPSTGYQDGKITVEVSENQNSSKDYAIITISSTDGQTATARINRDGCEIQIKERCKASEYVQVTIGTQTWMAENYMCSKYDTQSEAYKAKRYTIPTRSNDNIYLYNYVDITDKENWDTKSLTKWGVNLTDEQIVKLGYLYNWAAAVGLSDGYLQTTSFTGNRQGICPNGWHIPTKNEWSTLANFIDKNDGYTNAGMKLKTTYGWYIDDTYVRQGTDEYGFAALPAGYYSESANEIGATSEFWTATSWDGDEYSYNAYRRVLEATSNTLYALNQYTSLKSSGRSVRCLKN